MITDKKILLKCSKMEETYEDLIFVEMSRVELELFETDEHLRDVPGDENTWKTSIPGQKWGKAWGNAWFRGSVKITSEQAKKNIFIRSGLGGVETMLFIDGKPSGIFSSEAEAGARGIHHTLLIHKAGDSPGLKQLAFECYAGHPCIGTQPMDPREKEAHQPSKFRHFANGVMLMERRADVMAFVFDLRTLNQMVEALPESSFRRGKVISCLVDVYRIVPQLPQEFPEEEWILALAEAQKIMAPLLLCKNGDSAPFVGLTGHSHMDTAWLWTSKETIRKCARTFSNSLSLMEQYPEYRFIQSSAIHSEMVLENYPELFERIKERVADGRWEPNGGAYVESDGNMPSGESLIRQFLYGQQFTKRHFDYLSDTFWLPDTFGYSVAFPQILQGCGIKYFLTTKLSWNDTNAFPYDTFRWRGLDGSEVLVHFNLTHCWPDPKTLISSTSKGLKHKDVTDKRLISYGFGDGGGGPQFEMIEMTRRVQDLEGCPRSRHMSVTDFMELLEKDSESYPVYNGELYVELHRGVLTVQHLLKRLNRKCEWALHNLELLDVLGNHLVERDFIEKNWKVLLKNQFHDILPGTSIPEEHDEAKRSMAEMLEFVTGKTEELLSAMVAPGEYVTIVNPFSWDTDCDLEVPALAEGMTLGAPANASQTFETINKQMKTVVSGIQRKSLSVSSQPIVKKKEAETPPFKTSKNKLETPFYKIIFNENGGIDSMVDKRTGRELRGNGQPLNTFLIGEDVPKAWDNWDIDADQQLKMKPTGTLESKQETLGPLQFRIRQHYRIGRKSELWQDMVFHRNSPRVDFETKVEWKEPHRLLKAGFDLTVRSMSYRSDIQFGWIERPTHKNTSYDNAKFEVAQHKWTDLSETSYGVALLNDCKYGISVSDSEMRLSLLKSGGHPDPRGDEGIHFFNYALLPHQGGFNVDSVVKPAYHFNNSDLVIAGKAVKTESLVKVDAPNIVVETVKFSENGKSIVMRLFEAEGTGVRTGIEFGRNVEKVESATMLEDPENLIMEGGEIFELDFSAFQVRTLLVSFAEE